MGRATSESRARQPSHETAWYGSRGRSHFQTVLCLRQTPLARPTLVPDKLHGASPYLPRTIVLIRAVQELFVTLSPRKIPRPFHAGAAGALSVLPFSGIRVRGRITWHFGLLFSRWQRVDTRILLSEPARQYRPNMSARACLSSSLEDVVVGDGLAAITNPILDIRHVSHQAWTKMINQTLWRGQETLSPVWASAQKA